MPLPVKIVDVNTATFPDYKNVFDGVYNGLVTIRVETSNGSLDLGSTNEYVVQAYKPDTGATGHQLRIYVWVDKVGSPTFNVSCDLYADSGGDPDLSTKLASGSVIPAAAFPTTAKYLIFNFTLPANLDGSAVGHIVFKASAAGDASNHVRFYKKANTILTSTGSKAGDRDFGSSTWNYASPVEALRCVIHVEDATLWAFAVDKTNNKIRGYKSTDGGTTWSEVGSASAPACSSVAGYKSITIQQSILSVSSPQPTLMIALLTGSDANNIGVTYCSTGMTPLSGVWGSNYGTGTIGPVSTDVAGNVPIHAGIKQDGTIPVLLHQGATETVMGTARRRIKLFNAGSVYDVVGSANSPAAGTLPGDAVHYSIRLGFMDADNNFHIFYSKSDSNNIQHRVFKSDGTFDTINTIGSTPAVCSNTSAYPVGLGCNYYKNNEWRIAFVYLDSTSGTIKVAHCKASDSATASAWTIEQVSADTPETTTSNLGFVISDSQQSAQLVVFYVKSDDTIWMTKDNGTGTWSTPVQWRSGQAAAGLSGYLTARNVNLQYLNTAPATDELQFDRL